MSIGQVQAIDAERVPVAPPVGRQLDQNRYNPFSAFSYPLQIYITPTARLDKSPVGVAERINTDRHTAGLAA